MNRRVLSFVALAITLLYGIGFAVIDTNTPYAVVGGVVVALSWVAVGMLGREEDDPE